MTTIEPTKYPKPDPSVVLHAHIEELKGLVRRLTLAVTVAGGRTLFNDDEACAYLGIETEHAKKAMDRVKVLHELKEAKIGMYRRWSRVELDRLVELASVVEEEPSESKPERKPREAA